MKNVTCNSCGWVYFEVSREYAENEVKSFNKYFGTLSKKQQKDLYGGRRSNIKNDESCWCKNPYTNFRNSKKGDCPDGSTQNPIINRNE